ncbi:chromate transporter [Halanaerobium sp. Z-7514]|uniref:Chromate transporter n=1 Tax=Halanaerobium polyolivorans TaxID=2886943 RepID=A0AAW4WW02_9FIRM|nr:chromate transporter [Halanaerobium polyolivorans]MCC3143918.1 chromate transporter [Halanaerobium polyolivorans]RQD79563.1 MAG: chromate transporter [Halanaerobium sp. MSAO_Bac5]
MLELIITLMRSFFKVGMFGFGGGYAMISLLQRELERYGWLTMQEFVDIIAIAQMTPGAIAVNSGTFVGFKSTSSIFGAFCATLAVIAPSFILVLLLAHYYKKIKDSDYIKELIRYIRPTVIALIILAALSLVKTSIIDLKTFIISVSVLTIMLKSSLNPIALIVLAGISGALIY